jgi:flagellar biogenesis protein FliO
MQKITADYRSGLAYVVVGFLFVWSIIWSGAAMNGLVSESQNVTINGRQATQHEAFLMQAAFFLIGIVVFIGAICLLLMTLNRKVVLDGQEFTSYTWKGKIQLQTSLSQILSVKESAMGNGVKKYTVSTTQGEITLDSTMRNAFALKQALENSQSQSEVLTKPVIPVFAGGVLPFSPFVPAERTFRYLFSGFHLFSFIWIGALIAGGRSAFFDPKTQGTQAIPGILGILCFMLPGVWMQMTGWTERIKLGPDGIEWIDWKGKLRAKATLDQIREINIMTGKSRSMQIETDNGSVKASGDLWGFGNLKKDVERVIETRQRPKI